MLRKELTVSIGHEPDVVRTVVREITPLQAEKLHRIVLGALETAGERVTARELADLLVGDAHCKLELLQECCELGEQVRELGALAFMQLWEAFEEANAPFLERLAGMLRTSATATTAQTAQPAP